MFWKLVELRLEKFSEIKAFHRCKKGSLYYRCSLSLLSHFLFHQFPNPLMRLLCKLGCFMFKFTFHIVFLFKWALTLIIIWGGFMEYQNRKNLRSLLATEHAKLGLVINWVKFNHTLTWKHGNLTFHMNVCIVQCKQIMYFLLVRKVFGVFYYLSSPLEYTCLWHVPC